MKTTRLFHRIAPFAAAFAMTSIIFADDATVNSSDKSFVKDAYKGGLAEIKFGELAQKKTANPEVKTFASQLVTDHSKANAELKVLADSKKIELASEPGLMAEGKLKLLDAKSGSDFDKAFAETMVKDHKSDIAAFEKASNEAQDADVKAYAAKCLPTLKLHLSIAEGVWDKVGR